MENENLVIRSAETGAYFKTRLEELMEIHPIIGDVRGIGMLLAVELVADRKTKNKFSPNLKIPVRLNEKFQNHNLLLIIYFDSHFDVYPKKKKKIKKKNLVTFPLTWHFHYQKNSPSPLGILRKCS